MSKHDNLEPPKEILNIQGMERSKMLDTFIADAKNISDFSDIDSSDIAIPFINILQDLSPQVKKGPAKIEGCESGDIFESVNNTVWKGEDGIIVVPCAFQKRFVEWIPRKKGGGFVASHENDKLLLDCTVSTDPDDKGKLFLPNGNELVPTSLHFVLVMNGISSTKAVISMTKTKRKKSRQWIGMMTTNRISKDGAEYLPRMFQYYYHLTTVLEARDNNTYFNWKIGQPVLQSNMAIYEEAKRFNSTFSRTKVNLAESEDL